MRRFTEEEPLSLSSVVAFYFERVTVALQRAQSVAFLCCSAAVEGVGASLPLFSLADPTSMFDVGHVRAPLG